MDSNDWKVHELGKLEFSTADNPFKKYSLLCKSTLTIRSHLQNDEVLTLRICFEEIPPIDQFFPNLTWKQIQALWLIAEGDLIPEFEKKGFPGWYLAEKLGMKHSQFSRDVIKPLERRHLICHEDRHTTKSTSTHPNKKEKAYHLDKINMRNTFFILLDVFNKRHLNNLVNWRGCSPVQPGDLKRENIIAEMRLHTLAYLQQELDKYESSPQYYIDRGVNPPSSLAVSSTA